MSPDTFWKISPCNVYEKSSECIFTIYVFKNEAVCREVQTHSGCSPLAMFTVETSGRNLTIYVSKNEAVCCWVQTHFGSFRLARLIKCSGRIFTICASNNKVVCREVQTNLKFSACEFYRNSSGRNYTIYVSKNEEVCREVQMHSGSSFPASFTDTVLDAIPRFMCLKTKRFPLKFRRILEGFRLQNS